MKATFQKRIALFITNNVIGVVRIALVVALTATLFISSASAETYSLTTRVKPGEAGAGGLPSGKTYCDLTSSDTVNVTTPNAQLYFNGVDSATLDCNIEISGKTANNGEKTGKFRMQMGVDAPVNLYWLSCLAKQSRHIIFQRSNLWRWRFDCRTGQPYSCTFG